MIPRMTAICKKLADGLTFKKILLILLGAMICTFGIHNIHQRTNITEGGVIGLMLLVEHWLKISPAYITPKRVVKDFLIKFTKKPQKKCQKHFHAPDTQAGGVTCGHLTVRHKGTHIPAVGRYRVSSAA